MIGHQGQLLNKVHISQKLLTNLNIKPTTLTNWQILQFKVV